MSLPKGNPRAFTIAEMAVVVAVVGVVSAASVLALSDTAARGKRASQLKSVFSQLEQIRAKHLSNSSSPTACLHISATSLTVFELDERLDCATATLAVPHDFKSTVFVSGDFCIDSLARPADCSDLTRLRNITFDVETDGREPCEGVIVWRENGRLTANFAVDDNPNADIQAHVSDAASSTTPNPTAIGQFPGEMSDPRGLFE